MAEVEFAQDMNAVHVATNDVANKPSQVKMGEFRFGEDVFRLRYVLNDPVKFVAKDVAGSLKYQDAKRAIRIHVDDKYKSTFEHGEIRSHLASNALAKQGDPLYLHPHTVLITKEGVIQLIMKSKLPYAVELQAWLLEEVIPQVLCTGKYAPAIAEESILRNEIVAKTEENKQLATALIEANGKIILFAGALVEANAGLLLANKNLHDANQTIGQMANRMADIAQDVIAKPSNPNLCHSLAVCALGGDQYAFLRPQKRNMKRSLDRLSVDNREIVFKREYVPNAINVLNKVKESLPRDKFKARHNKITLLEDLTKEDLVEAINSSRQVAILAKNFAKN
ncbi:Ld-bro-p [Lymantria dispar multiple nucleopolyhedrovirus]|jgi:prophage antirepressor-like protein|uniref:Ld-bro-p n=1 Tax=Lymantria dispar multicapsid nuclear polyhedrosis virus TaxID=10449 RepID=Q9YMG7_NPVLD|nr:Ld-bro-p [Lymantria dispar multiple nucleopolyhedrovirus]AAC70347.1 Ld-bro-p [Lymantria dispar multiple nucleopolyhedrovirus]